MAHRYGSKFSSSHSTVIEAACLIVDYANSLNQVVRICLGRIDAYNDRKSCKNVVKILDECGCILLRVTQKGGTQEIRLYTSLPQDTKLAIARFLRNNNY